MAPHYHHRPAILHTQDGSATTVQITDDIAVELFGGRHLNQHNRFQENRTCFTCRLFNRNRTGHFKGHFARVYFMIRPIVESDDHVDHRISGDNAVLQCFADTVLDGFDIFLWHSAANNGIDKLKALATLVGCHFNPHITVLAVTAGLPDELALRLRFTGDGLTIGDLGTPNVCLYLELAKKAINDDLRVHLAHGWGDGLTRLGDGAQREGGVFFGQFVQRDSHLILIAARLWLNGNRNHRLREDNRLQDDRMRRIAERITGEGVAQAHRSADVTSANLFDILAVIGMHT